MLDNFVAPYDATVVARLKAAGTVMLGKANMDEFAMVPPTRRASTDPSKIPGIRAKSRADHPGGRRRRPRRAWLRSPRAPIPGGVDPSACALTGVTGVKPTYGRVSRYG